jgi:hypothetical protein
MTEREKEERIAYYLYKKGAKPNSSSPIQTEKVARDTSIDLRDVSAFFGNSIYFDFTKGTTVGLILTREGVNFVETRNKRLADDLIKWARIPVGAIPAILAIVKFFRN